MRWKEVLEYEEHLLENAREEAEHNDDDLLHQPGDYVLQV